MPASPKQACNGGDMNIPQLALALVAILQAPPPAGLTKQETQPTWPQDPFQRTATKALQGKFGKLSSWQQAGYERGLKLGVTANRTIWLTGYYATEGHDGHVDCRGRPCTYRTAAANLVPQGSYIWTRYGIRENRDRGAHSNDKIARRKGASLWCDYWYPSGRHCPFGGSVITTGAVVLK